MSANDTVLSPVPSETAGSQGPDNGRVAVVGSINLDISARVAHHPSPGSTVLGTDATRSAGGKGANQAVAAARAGDARTTFIGAVGDDPTGAELVERLGSEGIETIMKEVPATSSGLALITVDDNAENAITVVPGANQHLIDLDEAGQGAVAAADVVLCQLEAPVDALTAAADVRRPGSLLILNAAPVETVPEATWRLIDLLVVNQHEAIELAQTTTLDDAIPGLLDLVPAVIVTDGVRGSHYRTRRGDQVHVPAFPVDAIDTTAAGDTFCGVLAARIAQGDPVDAAMRQASAAAALTTTRRGAQSSIPTAAETAELIARDADATNSTSGGMADHREQG